MNATATEFRDVTYCMFEYLYGQKEPITQTSLKCAFFNLCRKVDFDSVIELLIELGIVERQPTAQDFIVGVPHVMKTFREKQQATT